jgi:hypothetical protein
MNRKPLIALVPMATLALAGAAHAQYNQQDLNFGGSVGFYMPTNSVIKDAFGKSVINYGIGPVGTNRPTSGSISPSLQFISANKNGNKLFIGTFTYGYEKHLADDKSMTVPYIRGFGGLSYFDFGIGPTATRVSDKKFGYTGGAEVGLVFARRIRLSAQYNFFSKVDGFDFNGLTLSATYALFKL